MNITNSGGKIFYGMHFYPGVAQYSENETKSFKIFINEATLRRMDPTFAGKPIFVEHVDEVNPNVSELRKEADGWVVESFYNKADGKHWVKFIIVSEHGERAIKNGMRLSNAYVPKSYASGGIWNAIEYEKEITDGDFEHLALVRNPRYEESIIMTPDEFKKYNSDHEIELTRIANSKDKGEPKMSKFNFFKKAKMENGADLESVSVTLPKSGKEKSITQLINEADEKEMTKNDDLADMSKKVKMKDGSMCNVSELMEKHNALSEEHEALKKKMMDSEEPVKEVEEGKSEIDVEGDKKNEEVKENAEDDKKKALQLAEEKEKEIVDAKKKNNFEALKNAPDKALETLSPAIELLEDQVARGRSRYGSN